MQNGVPTVCVPDPATRRLRSSRTTTTTDVNGGGPHGQTNAAADIDGGKMDGFIGAGRARRRRAASNPTNPTCTNGAHVDVMGYHDAREIPNYWAYAQQLRPAGPHVRAERVLEPARAPVHGLGVVGDVLDAQATR